MVNCAWCAHPIEELPLRKVRLKVNFTHTEGAETEYQSVCYHRWLTRDELNQIAIADGFSDWVECFQFFRDMHGFPFKGVLIKWGVAK